MITPQRANTRRPATVPPTISLNSSRRLYPFAAASLAALVLSACGGGDGSSSSVEAAQGSEASEFRSFVAVNPQVQAAIEATPIATKPPATKAVEEENADDADADADADDADAETDGSDEETKGASSSIVDTMVSDMSEMVDLPLKNVNRQYGFSRGPGYVQSGVDSGGSNYLLPWFVQFEGEGNSARHTRVEMRNLRLFVKSSSSGRWERLLNTNSYAGIQCDQGGNYLHCPQLADVQDGEGSASSLPLSNLNLHGWWGARAPIDGWNLDAIVVSLEARLAVDGDSGIDDRSQAKYLVHVGADYYPEDAPQHMLAPVGVSRAKLVTNDWQTFVLTTLNDVGRQEPGGGISEAELRANPPPLH